MRLLTHLSIFLFLFISIALAGYENAIIESIEVKSSDSEDYNYLANIINLKVNENFDEKKLKVSKDFILDYMKDKGYWDSTIKEEITATNKDSLSIKFHLVPGEPIRVKVLRIVSKDSFIPVLVKKKLKRFNKQIWNKSELSLLLDEITTDLKNQGYHFAKLEIANSTFDMPNKKVIPTISLELGKRIYLSFQGSKILSQFELLQLCKNSMNKVSKDALYEEYVNIIHSKYLDMGIYNTQIDTRVNVKLTKAGNKIYYYNFEIHEGHKVKLKSVSFIGSKALSIERINELFHENATVLTQRKFYDKKYLDDFMNILKKTYLEDGFVFIQVSDPLIIFDEKKRGVNVEYRIIEGIQSTFANYNLKGIDQALFSEIIPNLSNKPGEPFNTVDLAADLNKVEIELKKRGYYFAKIKNKQENDIVTYSKDFRQATVYLDTDLDQKLKLNKFRLIGNFKSKDIVILREATINPGEIITPEALDEMKNNLNTLNLFSDIKIHVEKLVPNGEMTDVIVEVKEKDFGYVEVAPGYRTDIGLKLSGGVGYNNLWGMNRSVAFKGQVNQRLSKSGLDAQRMAHTKNVPEYYNSVTYNEPYLFSIPIAYQMGVDNSMKRYSTFDASTNRINASLSKDLTKRLSTTLLYQYERIKQYDATLIEDNDTFAVGSLTPSLSLDFRDNTINPLSGAYFNLSCEVANPTLLSQDYKPASSIQETQQEINFYKLIYRNKFYIPMQEGVVAISLAAGIQENKAKHGGYIPKIKLFRLNGIDTVRGFRDGEINRLKTGEDINVKAVTKKAYFNSIKIEPRFFINSDMMLGIFYDAGHVYLESSEHFEVRQAVGLSYKYLTPVGSLDFEYGFKLDRKSKFGESPGSFNISIGFF